MFIHLSLSVKDVVLCYNNFSHRSSHVIFSYYPSHILLSGMVEIFAQFFPHMLIVEWQDFDVASQFPSISSTHSSLKLSNLSVKLETQLLFLSSHKSFLCPEQLMLQVSNALPLIHRMRELSALGSQTLLHSSLLQTFSPSMCLAKAECNFSQLQELAARWCSLSSEN